MPNGDEIPLPTGIWLSALRTLSETCANDNGFAEDRAIRRAFHFLKLSPRPIATRWDSGVSENEIEGLLELGKAQEAAAKIIGADAELELLSAQHSPRHVAILRYDEQAPVSAEAATPTLAIISAWARFFGAAA